MVDFSIKNLSFRYPDEDKFALKDINIDINRGEFTVVCGPSGSGKSTLLRCLKPELSPLGEEKGEILYFGKHKNDFSLRDSAEGIGYLLQNTEYQTVTHSVRTELAFGLENLGIESSEIRLRIAEICAYFSLEDILDKKISELSGGQKQLLCLASILTMHPKAVIFDEPTSQLDPVAAEAFIFTINKLCRENGITVIVSEHRLENLIPLADRLIVLQDGGVIFNDAPEKLPSALFKENTFVNLSMPAPMRILSELTESTALPLDVSRARLILQELLGDKKICISEKDAKDKIPFSETAVEAKGVYFSYDRKQYVLNDFSIKIPKGSFYAILGANGAGKSTAISLMSGILPCKTGKIRLFGEDIKKISQTRLYNGTVAVMPQNCESLFSCNTIREELFEALPDKKLSQSKQENAVCEVSQLTQITHILGRHPYDISGGEMQRAALALILLRKPRIIFMDEPTKGTDSVFKKQYAKIINSLCEQGITVIAVSHDTGFCAEYAHMCAMIFDGQCITQKESREFFASNFFYTTAANKIARQFFPFAVTDREVIELCKKSLQS